MQTLGHIPLTASHSLACPRVPVAKVMYKLPIRYIEALEQNQQISSCCRHPENHSIEAWFSSPQQAETGAPDIYKFFCTCGRVHVRFCVGGDHPLADAFPDKPEMRDIRPRWSA